MIRFVLPVVALLLAGCATVPGTGSCPTPASAPNRTGINIEAIEGSPATVADAFTQGFAAIACARTLPYGIDAEYSIHGYLSVVSSPAGTLLIYVFDVLDASRTRVTRVSGQYSSATVTTDPWALVATTMVTATVTDVVDNIAAWIAANDPIF
jgi:hypothetical protein